MNMLQIINPIVETPGNLLDYARTQLAVVDTILEKYGNLEIQEYISMITAVPQSPPYQSRGDFVAAVYRATKNILGEESSQNIAEDLTNTPVIITTNHHGVDYFSASVQGSILFASGIMGKKQKTVPILACSNIPVNNATYPRGLLLYDVSDDFIEKIPLKLPVLPKKYNSQIVHLCPPIEQRMIKDAQERFHKMIAGGKISRDLLKPFNSIFTNYDSNSVTSLPDYSTQSVLLNAKIWRSLFEPHLNPPEIVYLNQEDIVNDLLEKDIVNSDSLLYKVLFDGDLRSAVLKNLNGLIGCWDLNKLYELKNKIHTPIITRERHERSGTVFFWGLTKHNRKIPLFLDASDNMLKGRDDSAEVLAIEFSPKSLFRGIQENTILPSIFTCFLTLAFSRNIICLGGYFQSDYLPRIKKGFVKALQQTAKFEHIASWILPVPVDRYLSGMTGIMFHHLKNQFIPAGILEIIRRPITREDINTMRKLTVYDAHIAGLLEIIPDIAAVKDFPLGWKEMLGKRSVAALKGKVVLK